jgi:hypothetical protein
LLTEDLDSNDLVDYFDAAVKLWLEFSEAVQSHSAKKYRIPSPFLSSVSAEDVQ